MATTLFFNGRVSGIPGSYSVVDASGLESVGLGSAGIIAVLGTAEGGTPANAITNPVQEFKRALKPETVRKSFRSGDLRDVGDVLFSPARDADVPGGAQEVVFAKVNPATQSTLSLENAAAADVIDLTSLDYGGFTTQINVLLAAASGALTGYALTITFEDTVEFVDGLAGDAIATIAYDDPNGWDTLIGSISPTDLDIVGSQSNTGLDGDITVPTVTTDVTVESDNVADTTQQITVYGVIAGAVGAQETVTLNGTTAVTLTTAFVSVFGAKLDSVAAGTVTVKTNSGGTTMFSIATTVESKGLISVAAGHCAGNELDLSGTAADIVVVSGLNEAGVATVEAVTLTGGTDSTTAKWSQIIAVVLGDVPAGNTTTWTTEVYDYSFSTVTTLRALRDLINVQIGVPFNSSTAVGHTLTINIANVDFLTADVDANTALAIDTPASAVVGDIFANLWTVIDWINANSQLISAAKASGATTPPATFANAKFMTGGIEGTALATHWQAALDQLKQVRVNSVVVLTGDAAVHAALEAHCSYMTVVGRSERDGFVGIGSGTTASFTLKDKTTVKSEVLNLNSRHVRAFAQSIERYSPAGVKTSYPPWYFAALAAGAQSGSSVGTSLTHKYLNILGFDQDSTWNPVDDAEELIQAGLAFVENVEGVGRRLVRNVTTHLTSNNVAFTEGSVNEATNVSVYNFRTNLEFAVGKKGFAGTITAARSVAVNTLGLLVDGEILTAYRSLNIELVVDVMEVSVEIAPVIPINFVASTVHLVTIQQAA